MIYKKIIFIFLLCLLIILPATSVLADWKALEGLYNTAYYGGYVSDKTQINKSPFTSALIKYANSLILLMAPLYLILIIYAGYLWMNSRGNQEEVAKAKKIIIWSTAGITIIILARIIAEFVILSLGTAAGIPGS